MENDLVTRVGRSISFLTSNEITINGINSLK